MGNVLVEFEKINNTTELLKYILEMAFKYCNIEVRFCLINQICNDDLEWCDSYLAVRPNSPMSYSLAKVVKSSGRFYAVLFDDDLLHREGALKWRLKSARKCIQLADLVISPNPVLAKEYSLLMNKERFTVINTPVSNDEYIPTHILSDKVRFVYAAGRDHGVLFEKLIKPVLNVFLSRHSDKVHFTFIGVEPDISDIENKECFSFVPLMALQEYNEYMKNNTFDVGLAPLENTRFSNRKYFNKYIEYTKVGIAGMYSNCLPYTLIVKDYENGFLVNNTPKDWLNMLELAVTNKSIVEQCAINAQNTLKKEFTVECLADVIIKQIAEFIVNNNNIELHWRPPIVKTKLFLVMDKVSKLIYQIHNNGVKSATKLIQNYINDRK